MKAKYVKALASAMMFTLVLQPMSVGAAEIIDENVIIIDAGTEDEAAEGVGLAEIGADDIAIEGIEIEGVEVVGEVETVDMNAVDLNTILQAYTNGSLLGQNSFTYNGVTISSTELNALLQNYTNGSLSTQNLSYTTGTNLSTSDLSALLGGYTNGSLIYSQGFDWTGSGLSSSLMPGYGYGYDFGTQGSSSSTSGSTSSTVTEQTTSENSCGTNAKWSLSGSTLTISGSGAMTSYYSSDSAPWASKMKSGSYTVKIESGITSIGSYAFAGQSITSISLPGTIKTIEDNAFSGCTKLTSIVIPASVETIDDQAFKGCTGLKTMTFKGIPLITDDAFSGCKFTAQCTADWDASEKMNYGGSITWKIGTSGGQEDTGAGDDIGDTGSSEECPDGHVSDGGTVTTPATYGSKGVMTYKCRVCGAVIKTQKIAKLKVPTPTLGSVKNKKGQQLNVKWKSADDVTGYLVQYATNDSFSDRDYVRVKGEDSVSTVLKGLEMGAVYYVRIRAYIRENGKNHYSGYSKVKSVEITK